MISAIHRRCRVVVASSMVSSVVMPAVVMVVACAESYKAEGCQSDADDFAHVAVSFYGLNL